MEKAIEQLATAFRGRFSSTARLFRAPGRVNLIGEHTDYNDGFVMPFAIDRHVTVAGSIRNDSTINVYAADLDEAAAIDLDGEVRKKRGNWIDYVEGTARCVIDRFGDIEGADLIITSTVPIGAGLSSSAAIEVGVGYALLSLNSIGVDRTKLAFASQSAEHEFVGIRSGIMDQFASVFGKSGNAMLLDCRSLEIEYVPIAEGDVAMVVIDTKVKHNLAASEYNTRREECEAGVRILSEVLPGISSLRDVSKRDLEQHGTLLPDKIFRRCRHVVFENDRTLAAAEAFKVQDFQTAGGLMYESHRSLRDDYEVSCAELDFLVETAERVEGVLGARMTGGGFGGCTVNVVRSEAIDALREESIKSYAKEFGFEPDVYVFHPADGASEVTV